MSYCKGFLCLSVNYRHHLEHAAASPLEGSKTKNKDNQGSYAACEHQVPLNRKTENIIRIKYLLLHKKQ